MFSTFATARRKSGKLLSHVAVAVALAGGAVVGSAVYAPAAQAQDYSRGFVGAYEPVADLTTGETPDWAAAKAGFESVVAAVETADDRDAAGNLALQIGNGLNDPALQRRGLELRLASGNVPPEQIGQFQFFVGNLAFNAQDWAASRAALNAAMAAGYTSDDPSGLVVETYLREGLIAEGVAYAMAEADKLEAAGQPVPEVWSRRALSEAYNADLLDEAVALSKLVVRNHPTSANWTNALQIVGSVEEMSPQVELDLLRLMRETDSMTRRAEFVRYIEAADPRIMANEVLPVLQAGLDSGEFTTDNEYYVEVKAIADSRAAADRRNPEGTIAEGMGGDALDAMISGNVMYSLGDYAGAANLYQAAADKGGDAGTAMTRKGMAQIMSGDLAGGIATLGMVTGERAAVAEMWALYAQTQMN